MPIFTAIYNKTGYLTIEADSAEEAMRIANEEMRQDMDSEGDWWFEYIESGEE